MLSTLDNLFYEDIELWGWETAVRELTSGEVAIDKAKESAWRIIRSHNTYKDVVRVSNTYACMLCMELEKHIELLLPCESLTFFRTIDGKKTSLYVSLGGTETMIKNLSDVQELLDIAQAQ